ncbi:hypothetical protein A2954_00775 [Candidatus Roizmanbacteria bacterium RIFCSPLOWO2_01_FULL_37_12]|uniref:Glycosyltransferase RgtA/B/C/D-like domain-containing protein n=1 Tax=Candidatus Roizmanbacteria bacterium RIFCSPLOWO2_01_FULL_37_12 TaxID=1802056 RepID=A0A1F7IDS9_9BACT|nr:MAG: hypothetical protein A2954_00775 [Candidatus Roizmanbacteria bacterium RIFCSPLOWO2_01_FULL_37_12]
MLNVKSIILIFLIWRVLIFIPLIVGNKYLPYRANSSFTNIWHYTKPYFPVDSPLLYPWANFDGVHYLAIAAQGYSNNERFFPLYPMLISIVSKFFAGSSAFGPVEFFTALFLANIFFVLSLINLYRLILLDFKESVARLTVFYLLLFPTSFFFVSIYSESLFLLLLLLSFYFARQKKWLQASLCGMLVTVTRPVGFAIIPALFFEFFKTELSKNKNFSFKKFMPLLLLPLGIISYLVYNFYRFGNAWYFLKAQGELGNSRSVNALVFPLQTIYRYFKILLTVPRVQYEWWIALLELTVFVISCVLLYIAWNKVRTSYFIFAAIAFLIPAFSGTFTGLPRYLAVLFPLFIALALSRNRIVIVVYTVCASLLLFILLMLFSRGFYIA